MKAFIDTHVHLYPCYDLAQAVSTGLANMTRILKNRAALVLCLTERNDCSFFADLAEGKALLDSDRFEVEPGAEDGCVLITTADGRTVYLIAGRQIISRERLEVLALGKDLGIADGKPVRELLVEVREEGAVPVLSWAPGKWLFKRRPHVEEAVSEADRGELALGDTTLRPPVWGEPKLMRLGRSRGLPVLAGSDPLPFEGEEQVIASYGLVAETGFNEERPVSSLRTLLLHEQLPIAGKRSSTATVLKRVRANAAAKKEDAAHG